MPHYTVTFSGECVIKNQSGIGSHVKAFKPLTLKFDSLEPFREIHKFTVGHDYEKNIPIIEERRVVNIQGVIRRDFGHRYLSRIPGFKCIRKIGIDAVEAHNGAPWEEIPVRFLSRSLLEKYIKLHHIPLDPRDVEDTGRLRSLVMCFDDDKETFYRRLDELKNRVAHEHQYRELNADLPEPELEDAPMPKGISPVRKSQNQSADGGSDGEIELL